MIRRGAPYLSLHRVYREWSRLVCLVVTWVALLLGVAAARSQDAKQATPAAAREGETRACTAAGFGAIHHPVRTSSAEAQNMFDRGMALDYGFNHSQAKRCFERAASLDPGMAMAYWGIALVLGTNYNLPVDADREKQAYLAVQKALTLSRGGPLSERDYIAALAKRYTNDASPDYDSLEAAY